MPGHVLRHLSRLSLLRRDKMPALFLVFLLCAVGAQQARAAADDLYTVSAIPVDVVSESADLAKQQAVASARQQASVTLMQRLTRKADWSRLPVPDEGTLSGMVASFQVANEKTAPDRYIADLTFSFQPDVVRGLLNSAGIPFTETRALPAVILPVLRAGGDMALWADPNPWLAAWARFDGRDRLVPIIAPFGDVDDVLAISAEQAVTGQPGPLDAMAERYRAESVLVADASLTVDAEQGVARIDILLHSFGPDPYPSVIRSFESTPDADVVQFMNAAVDLMVVEIEDLWKQRTIESFGDLRLLSALVPIRGLADWQALERTITSTSVVRKLDLTQISVQDAIVVLHHLGDEALLRRALAQQNLVLAEKDGYWTIRRAGDVAGVQQ